MKRLQLLLNYLIDEGKPLVVNKSLYSYDKYVNIIYLNNYQVHIDDLLASVQNHTITDFENAINYKSTIERLKLIVEEHYMNIFKVKFNQNDLLMEKSYNDIKLLYTIMRNRELLINKINTIEPNNKNLEKYESELELVIKSILVSYEMEGNILYQNLFLNL